MLESWERTSLNAVMEDSDVLKLVAIPTAPRKAQFPAGERGKGAHFNECQANSGERPRWHEAKPAAQRLGRFQRREAHL